VTFAADDLPREEVRDVGARFDDLASEFMPDYKRYRDCSLGPFVPVVDVEVGTADGSSADADQDVVNTDLWNRYILDPETGFCF
jgi:hypothetical protein